MLQSGIRHLPAAKLQRTHPIGQFVEGQDAAAFARNCVSSLRAFSETTFLGAIDPGRGPQTERHTILDRFYAAYEADVMAAPRAYLREAVNCIAPAPVRHADGGGGVIHILVPSDRPAGHDTAVAINA